MAASIIPAEFDLQFAMRQLIRFVAQLRLHEWHVESTQLRTADARSQHPTEDDTAPVAVALADLRTRSSSAIFAYGSLHSHITHRTKMAAYIIAIVYLRRVLAH